MLTPDDLVKLVVKGLMIFCPADETDLNYVDPIKSKRIDSTNRSISHELSTTPLLIFGTLQLIS